MKKKMIPATVNDQADEITLTIEDFLAEIPRGLELGHGFRHLAQQEKIQGHKTRAEWSRLFELYKNKPTNKSWIDHIKEVK